MVFGRRGFIGGTTAAVLLGQSGVATGKETGPSEVFTCSGMSERAWREFIGAQDLVWKRPPTQYGQAPFLGDGRLGSVVYAEGNVVRFTVQHADVQDHRDTGGSQFGVCRLPVGNLKITAAGEVTGVDWRLDLWNAELRGTVTTSLGVITFAAYVHSERSVFSLDVTASGTEQPVLAFEPSKAIPPRADFNPLPDGYVLNPDPVTAPDGRETLVTWALNAGGQTATAFRIDRSGRAQRLLLSVAHTYPAVGAASMALRAVRRGVSRASHRRWWNTYYRKSFLSFGEQRLQAFYWIQLYKVASGSRAGGPVMATTGPWLEKTPWAAAWWNLNVQLEYWLIHGSGHLELDAITSTLKDNQEQLARNVKEPYRHDSAGVGRSTDRFTSNAGTLYEPGTGGSGVKELGNLTWALHNVWLSYRHSMDARILSDVVFPLLRRSINYYLHFLRKGDDGKLHLDVTTSPEYGDAPDCNYDLQLIRWGCQTLVDSAALLRIADPLEPRWREVLRDLVPYPVDANGFMVGAGVPFAVSHRHFSHLLATFPLMTVNWDQPENRALIEKSLHHWMSLEPAHRGYSYSGSGSIAARMFRGDEAYAYLVRMFDVSKRFPVLENTMYTEAGPVVETPLSGAQTIHDFVCQSWGGVVRVFPAVPSVWPDVMIADHSCEGGFSVTARRAGGRTEFVVVRSRAGEPLVLRHGISGPVTVVSPVRYRDRGDGTLEIPLRRGQEVLVHVRGRRPDLAVRPVAISIPGKPWGLPA
ncbi:glycosyl hydrolase family 95 catalytic domain-containing protein [Lentzea sp. CA-135723]|uniref:glycosyl hydrolase family 95 catalytic domain-containing protein n=1 Tax=Lentzea sp. CA-135723 TaxID=3239950 RepID=UPI003D94D844